MSNYGTMHTPMPGKFDRILVNNGRVIDPSRRLDETLCLTIVEGRIASIGKEPPPDFNATITINAQGRWVTPGLVDMHVHLREPGREDKETLESGTRAAVAGGFTAVACMPNTTPALDEESKIRYVVQRSETCASRIYPIGSITKGLAGEELSPVGEMVRVGARAISDDGKSVKKSLLMKNALNYSKLFSIPVICHCEDSDLCAGGQMNEGLMSTRLGIRGIPSISEEIVVARDIMLAAYTGARVHIAHLSTAGSVDLVRDAKKRGLSITAETCPHYFILTDECLGTYDTNKKMNPPLRTEHDRQAIIAGLADGTIDVIASDHAPHVSEDKNVEFDAAAFGVIGLETSLAAVLTYLVKTDLLRPMDLVEKMSILPNRILGIEHRGIAVGDIADITVIDPQPAWRVDSSTMYSKSRNTAFEGFDLLGWATHTIVDGQLMFERS